ncbi:MAG: SRPBCC family protein [Acidimicrobiales bacterium]
MQGSVTVHMAAPPERVWSLVSDVTNTGKFSPETFEAEWLDGATGPAVGARFRGHVRRNGKHWLVYWTTCTITTCEPGHEFVFQPELPGGKPVIEWSYHLEPSGDGTDVTESFRLLDYFGSRIYSKIAGEARTRTNVRNMRATLDRIKAVAEAPSDPAS